MLQAQPAAEPDAEPETPQCDLRNPEQVPCYELESVVYLPADAVHLRDLSEGEEAIRATMMPSLGGRAVLYQLRGNRYGDAELLAIWFFGHPYSGWREIGRVEADVAMRDYRRLVRRADAALALPETETDEICVDGPVYRIERRAAGVTSNAQGGMCGPPGVLIVPALLAGFTCQETERVALPVFVRGECAAQRRTARELARELEAERAE